MSIYFIFIIYFCIFLYFYFINYIHNDANICSFCLCIKANTENIVCIGSMKDFWDVLLFCKKYKNNEYLCILSTVRSISIFETGQLKTTILRWWIEFSEELRKLIIVTRWILYFLYTTKFVTIKMMQFHSLLPIRSLYCIFLNQENLFE